MKICFLLLVSCLFFFYSACTNLQVGQTAQRFYDNMHGGLKTFSDPTVPSPTAFSFSAMADTHIGSPSGNLFVKALQMSQADGDSFVIVGGDNSNTGIASELNTFMTQAQSVSIPVFPAIGNHDIFFGGWANYKSIVGRSIYSFNAGNTHFIMLDSANGTIGEDQLNWLRNDLQVTTKTLKIVVLHFPVYMGEFSSIYKLASDEEITYFENIMNQYGVQLVISGHFHGYGDKTIGGTRYLVIGACNNLVEAGNRSAYLKISISGATISANRVFLDN